MAGHVRSRRSFLTGVAGGGAASMIALTGIVATSSSAEAQHAVPSTVDVGFCSDMTVHHVQALELCERVLGHDTGGAVQSAATEVLRNQSIEVGMMRAWLADWGASTLPPTMVMAWMDMDMTGAAMNDTHMADHADTSSTSHTHMADSEMPAMTPMVGGIPLSQMPGYATPAQLSELSMARDREKGRLWLELMRTHHVGGVAMANAATELASEEKVIRLARTQAVVQSYEIDQYDLLLESVYS